MAKKKQVIQTEYVWRKGQSGNPKGRPKKLITLLRKNGEYKHAQIKQVVKECLYANVDQLEEMFEHPEATVLERTVAHALLKGFANGDLSAFALLGQIAYTGEVDPAELEDLSSPVEVIVRRSKDTPRIARGEHEIEDA